MLFDELWGLMQEVSGGVDISYAVRTRSMYERIGQVTEIIRNAAERSSLSRWNGVLYCFTGKIYEQLGWRDVKNVVYDLMKKMGCPMSDFTKKDVITRDVIDVLDKNPLEVSNSIVVFNNCVLDTDTMKTYPHDKKYVQVTLLDYDYVPEARTFLWYQFLNEVLPDPEKQRILQMFLGAVFIDRSIAKMETMLILKGSGSNGKSVVFETVMGVLGRQNVSNFGLGALIGGNDRKMNIATMNGKRLNYCSEIQLREFGKDSDSLKAIISGEPIEARRIYGANFTARNIPLLMANANELPYLKDMSHGMARRLCVLSFDVEIPTERQNRSLAKEMQSEYAAIFNWIIEGRRMFIDNGYSLPMTHDLERAIDEYKGEYSSSLKFMMDMGWRRVADPNVTDISPRWISLRSLYERYTRWCTSNKVSDVDGKTMFSKTLAAAGWRKRNGGYGVEFGVYGKIALKDLEMRGKDTAQKIREKMIAAKIFRAEGRDYAQGMAAAAKACGVGRSVIERLANQGKLTKAITYADGRPLYDIGITLDVLRQEGFFLDTRELHIRACNEQELKYMRMKFNNAMRYNELPFRKYKTTDVPRIDGTIRVDDTMSIEEARQKAADGDFTGADALPGDNDGNSAGEIVDAPDEYEFDEDDDNDGDSEFNVDGYDENL